MAFVSPDSFTSFLSITFLVGVVVGGLASIPGAIAGAIFIQFVPNFADEISKSAPWAIYGIFLILLMYLMPEGTAGLFRRIWGRLRPSSSDTKTAETASAISAAAPQPVGRTQS